MWENAVQPDRPVYTGKSHRKEPRGRPRHRWAEEHLKKSYNYAVVVRSGFTLKQDGMRQGASVMLCNVN